MFHKMIQTWVMYENVKVLYLFGLKPTVNNNLETWSANIYNLVKYVNDKKRDDRNAVRAVKILFQKTAHTANWIRCTFGAQTTLTNNKTLLRLLPIVMLTWFCQLEEHFLFGDTDWNEYGRYYGSNEIDEEFPLGKVCMKNQQNEKFTLTEYNHVKPSEKSDTICPSLESWAMYILKPDIPIILDEAMKNDTETKKRWKKHGLKKQFKLTSYRTRISARVKNLPKRKSKH
jgi:hypothetical protein